MTDGPSPVETPPQEPERLVAWCRDHGVDTAVIGGADTHGIWRGKRVPVADLGSVLRRGVAISDVIFVLTHHEGSDNGEELVEPPGGDGYPNYFPRASRGFGDVLVRPDPAVVRVMPWHEATIAMTGDFSFPSGDPVPIGPRYVLRRTVERLVELGFEPMVGVEYEFYLIAGDASSVREAGRWFEPWRSRPYMYGVYGGSLDEDIIGAIRSGLAEAGVHVEASAPETGPGQFELNMPYTDAMRAADDALVFKTGVKEIAARHGALATFMAKPRNAWAGSSCHLHVSLRDAETGANAFATEHGGLSEVGRRFSAGLLATMRELSALWLPTPNSFKRLAPYSWAGTTVSWGIDNRSTGVRAIVGEPEGVRVEHRVPGADANPYLAIAACLTGGILGLEDKLEPPEPFAGDAYAEGERFEPLPASLDEAVDALEASELARALLGGDFVGHYAAMKRYESARYREQVTDWEVRRYVELA